MSELTINKVMMLLTIAGAISLRLELGDVITWIAKYVSIVSFCVILISNWSNFTNQLKKWLVKFRKFKNRNKNVG